MGTILNSISIICLSIAYILHIIYLHKPEKFEITEEDLERHNKLQKFIEETNRASEEYRKKAKEILENVPASSRNTESKSGAQKESME